VIDPLVEVPGLSARPHALEAARSDRATVGVIPANG
jgi:hypothetical protein